MTAVNGGDMTLEKPAQYLSNKLVVLYCQINRGRLLRRDMEDIDKKSWICVDKKVPEYSIK